MGFSAQTVLEQLGGRRFIAMTGSNNFVKGENFIRFKVHRAQKSIKYVKITLTAMDTYDMEFMTRSGKHIRTVDGIYADQLQETFTENTGLETRL